MPGANRGSRVPILAWTALALLLAISLTHRLRDTADRLDELRRGTVVIRLPFDVDLPQFTLSEVQPEASAAGLRVGDAITGLAGRPAESLADLFVPLREGRAGDRVIVQAASGTTASVELKPLRAGPPAPYDILYFALVDFAKPYVCVALGFWVAAVRIRRREAWILLFLLLGFAEFAAGGWRTLFGRGDAFQPVALVYQAVVATLSPVSLMLFGLYFPERLPLDRRAPWAKWLVVGPIALWVGTAVTMLLLLAAGRRGAALQVEGIVSWVQTPAAALQICAVLTFFIVMAWRTAHASSPDARRRLLLLVAGVAASVAPIFIYVLLLVAGLVELRKGLLLPLFGALFLFPVTMAYVIVVHRAMDVRVVIRQGVQYLLARGSLRVVQIALSVWIVATAATLASGRPAVRILLIAGGLAAVLLLETSAGRLRRWVDRRFFREAYDAELILSDLASSVRTMVQTGPLLETVARRVSETLHVPRVAILLNGARTLTPAYALGEWVPPTLAFPHDTLTPETGRELQEALGSELVLPLSSNQKLIGVISLGPKQSEEPFTGADIRLLDAVAAQTGLALENSRLTAEIASEIAQREKAKRELEIAHEVQERLFPQEYPPIAGLEYAGACRPALGVGGDYYDFIRFSDSELGIAIGDVSGKGMPAALLMATLRAYLRGQTIRGEPDLAGMMANLNALVYESSAANRYATFFYGDYNGSTRVLRYVNAGHNPPLVIRRSGDEVVHLDTGGPVIGLIEGCRYTQGSIALEPGDLLVAFTDGITEAMNAADEEWGEERLLDALRSHRALPSRQLIDRLMHAADEFVDAAPQHDDMTLVVIRLV